MASSTLTPFSWAKASIASSCPARPAAGFAGPSMRSPVGLPSTTRSIDDPAGTVRHSSLGAGSFPPAPKNAAQKSAPSPFSASAWPRSSFVRTSGRFASVARVCNRPA
jgi:hypothetical protein